MLLNLAVLGKVSNLSSVSTGKLIISLNGRLNIYLNLNLLDKDTTKINPISTEGNGGLETTFFKTAITQKIFPIIPPKTPL